MDPHETKIYNAILIAAGTLGIVVIYFIITIIRNQRRHLKLQHENLLVEITTLENERRRIVSDLHDELGPLLSVVKFQIMSLDTTDESDLVLIEKANGNLDDILERIRDICNQLMPQALIRKGLIMAINEFIGELDNKTPIQMSFKYEDIAIPASAEIHLYRMIQEIINNAIKHSKATSLDIHLVSKNNKLVVTIKDNGKGFSTEQVKTNNKGLGLKNILSRIDILRGDLYLASDSINGTSYTIEIPYE
jgi:two-component system, NarL family, sensor kinase